MVTVTIAAGQSLSTSADITNSILAMIVLPPQWTPAALSFQVSPDGSVFHDLFAADGTEMSVVASGGAGVLLASGMGAVPVFLKIRSGLHDAPIPQLHDADLVLVTV
jgi:hypothetical protein